MNTKKLSLFIINFTQTIVFLTLLFFSAQLRSQSKTQIEFGKLTSKELTLTSYDKAPESSAVVLYEKGEVFMEVVDNYITLVKEVHKKIKVFNLKEFDGATIIIPYYSTKGSKEKVLNIKAITHNGNHKQLLRETQIFIKKESEHYSTSNFTFPNVKDGSILEYKYRVESPFFQSFDWKFQGDYPKIYSEFNSKIPGNYTYRLALRGSEKIDNDTVYVKNNCFYIRGYGTPADCVVSQYIMNDVPTFLSENYMLSKENYISGISYELEESYDLRKTKTVHTKNWKYVDKEFKNDKEMGRQLNHDSFFEKHIPNKILSINNDLERAKAIYYFIQNHFIWNKNYRIFSDINVKDAFENKVGNITEINLALINALKVAKINTHISLSTTQDHAIPNQIYPTLTEFNYVMAYATIDDVSYFLDATNKFTEFGVLPIRALNTVARVMDFKKGSYWKTLEPHKKNVEYINAQLSIDSLGTVVGIVNETYTGFLASKKRNEISTTNKNDYFERKQKFSEIDNYKQENFDNNNKPIKETYSIKMTPEEVSGDTYFYPYFLMESLSENPFKSEKRVYPIELNYPINYIYVLSLKLSDNYKVIRLPKNQSIVLPEEMGVCKVVFNKNNNVINLRFNLKINQHYFNPEYYTVLKEFFSKVINVKTNEPIVIKKE